MNNNKIHPTAVIASSAIIGNNVEIGPYSVVGPDVKLADQVIVKSHVVISGNTEIGQGTTIFPFASIGELTQDKKFSGISGKLIIGKNNVIREYTTMNPATDEGKETIIGDDCLFMISTHVAHDCIVGNNVIMANNATLAGHVTVGDNAIIGGLSGVRQFVRIGTHAMIGGGCAVDADVIPYGMAYSTRAILQGLNLVGLKRHNFAKEEISALRKAFQIIFENSQETSFAKNIEKAEELFPDSKLVASVIEFIKLAENNAICKP